MNTRNQRGRRRQINGRNVVGNPSGGGRRGRQRRVAMDAVGSIRSQTRLIGFAGQSGLSPLHQSSPFEMQETQQRVEHYRHCLVRRVYLLYFSNIFIFIFVWLKRHYCLFICLLFV